MNKAFGQITVLWGSISNRLDWIPMSIEMNGWIHPHVVLKEKKMVAAL